MAAVAERNVDRGYTVAGLGGCVAVEFGDAESIGCSFELEGCWCSGANH